MGWTRGAPNAQPMDVAPGVARAQKNCSTQTRSRVELDRLIGDPRMDVTRGAPRAPPMGGGPM
eukprot:3329057-Pyramimonas_sp.AAC.1